MPNKIFTITKAILQIRKSFGSRILCNTCNGIIKVGDVVVTKGNGRQSIRHESCARRVGLID